MNLTYIIPTIDRPSLPKLVDAVLSQLAMTDELIVIADGVTVNLERIGRDERLTFFATNPTANGGSYQRNLAMTKAHGSHLLFLDDDDMIGKNAVELVKTEIIAHPESPILFRCTHEGGVIWRDQSLVCGNLSTQCLCVPNKPSRLGVWSDRYEADYDFIRSTIDLYQNRDQDIIWSEKIIASHNYFR